MSRSSSKASEWVWLASPWTPLLAGLALVVLAIILPGTPDVLAVKAILLVVALLLAAVGVARRLKTAGWDDFDERSSSAGLLAVAGGVPVLALMGLGELDANWDAARTALSALVGVCLVGAIILLLPALGRKIAISLILLFHFGGILTAVSSLPPPGAPAPWLVNQVWVRVYRPYLQFMYLNNAYHFYSPDPGPATLVWCHVRYEDGSTRWVKTPERKEFPTKQQYLRRVALGQSVDGSAGMPFWFEAEAMRRRTSGLILKIPLHPQVPVQMQYRPVPEHVKYLVASYVRHVASHYPSETNPSAGVKSLRLYRITHYWINPEAMAEDHHYDDPAYYYAYYEGEYDRDGTLLSKHAQFDPQGNVSNPNTADPFLYWLIPMESIEIHANLGGKP